MMTDDPIEKIIDDALWRAGIAFTSDPRQTRGLDFYCENLDLYIEVKQFHTPRIAEQMSRAPNVIAIQGRPAAQAFARMITSII